METRPDLDECGHRAPDDDPSASRRRDAGEQLEQRALPCTVAADDAQGSAARHVEADVLKRPEDVRSPPGVRAIRLPDICQREVDPVPAHTTSASVSSTYLKYM